MKEATPVQPEEMVVVLHDDYNRDVTAQATYKQELLNQFHLTMEAVRNEPDFNEDTFAESFDTTAFIKFQLERLEEMDDLTQARMLEVLINMKRVWTLISLCTKVPVPKEMVIMDPYVTDCYQLLVKARHVIDDTKRFVDSGTPEAQALVSKAAAAVKKNMGLKH